MCDPQSAGVRKTGGGLAMAHPPGTGPLRHRSAATEQRPNPHSPVGVAHVRPAVRRCPQDRRVLAMAHPPGTGPLRHRSTSTGNSAGKALYLAISEPVGAIFGLSFEAARTRQAWRLQTVPKPKSCLMPTNKCETRICERAGATLRLSPATSRRYVPGAGRRCPATLPRSGTV